MQGYSGVMQMLGGNKQRGSQANQQQPQQQQQQYQQQANQQYQQPPQYNEPPMDFDDDIPFAPIGLQYPSLLNCMG